MKEFVIIFVAAMCITSFVNGLNLNSPQPQTPNTATSPTPTDNYQPEINPAAQS